MSFDPVAAAVRYHAALDSQDLATVEKLLAPDARYVSPSLGDVKGRAAILKSMADYFATRPEHQAVDDEVIFAGPRKAFCRWHLEAVDKATGDAIRRRGTETVTFDEAGLVCLIEVEDAS